MRHNQSCFTNGVVGCESKHDRICVEIGSADILLLMGQVAFNLEEFGVCVVRDFVGLATSKWVVRKYWPASRHIQQVFWPWTQLKESKMKRGRPWPMARQQRQSLHMHEPGFLPS